MIKMKKIMALSLSVMLGLSLCACSTEGGQVSEGTAAKSDKQAEQKKDKDAEKESADGEIDDVTEPVEVAELEMPSEEGEVIYVYSWNQELGDRLQYFKDAYPQYADRVEYVNLAVGATSDDYKIAIETLLQAGNSENSKYPSIIATDSDMTMSYIQSDYTLPMSELGIGESDYANMFNYTVDFATFQGEVKALTWQATPGGFLYRTDMAEEILGASDPESVQKAVSDWNKFMSLAEKMKAAGYKMLSGSDDLKYAMLAEKEEPWVFDEILNIDPVVNQYLETSKTLYDNDYTNKTTYMDEIWANSFDSDVFGWFVSPAVVYWSINAEQHMGDFNVCQGPSAYYWGGTYLNVAKDCPDTALAALVLKTLCCDEDTMTKIAEATCDFMNHKAVMQKFTEDGKGNIEMLGGQNPIPVWMETADKIDASNVTAYDAKFNNFMEEASKAYNTGELQSVEDAIERIKDYVTEGYNYITVE